MFDSRCCHRIGFLTFQPQNRLAWFIRDAVSPRLQRQLRRASEVSVVDRNKPRKRVLLGGCVVYSSGSHHFNCSIRDISDAGARVSIPENQLCPDRVHLIDISRQIAYDGSVIWRKRREIGIKFERSFPVAGPPHASLASLRRIWVKRAVR